ncbi:subtilisin-like protease 4 [Aegilops tauschii subsp. strangulata]|uniref:subtilisin-like protease 4 n=1 Tax=Aegilops tauschii subsp. strangulata TaxID=200361 RepID=UPI00098B2C41|nr:subtilisin-like protease 4 [Aegilops tauschii subsp. strangulata]
MGSFKLSLLFPLLTFLLLAIVTAGDDLGTYVIHVQPQDERLFGTTDDGRKAWHQSFLPEHGRLLHSYHHVASGFAARLTRRELEAVSTMPGFVAAVPDVIYHVQTTHTPQFLGLDTALGVRNLSVGSGEGVIIGVLDTGVFPDHPSFSGFGMMPPPAKWKGRCDFNGSACNGHKLIGARTFISSGNSSAPGAAPVPPIDGHGHGTHTSSTAAGSAVPGAQVQGQGNGTASGIAPRAHLAMYKVCDASGACAGVDVLAGIDAAVSDGCDVISMSLGFPPRPFYNDSVAIGTFAAVEKGIFVSMAAGNAGPRNSSILNEAPWMLTVAASTMDRLISAQVTIGDSLSFDGESLYQPDNSVAAPLVYPGANSTLSVQFCGNGSLDGFDVKNKIVLCDSGNIPPVEKGAEVLRAGGAGIILGNQFYQAYITSPVAHVLPASQVTYAAGVEIKNYINSTTNPMANISFRGTVLGTSPAPVITFFSSRGPNVHSPGILKPDITGPGVNVIAAWPFQVGPPSIDLRPTFNILSGTSMSTPHLAGVAALIKSKHPDWSPAAIKSAIMTTADVTDRSGTPILDEQHKAADLFAVGAGHVNPDKAVDPGLVFDISPDDYIGYLCGMYKSEEVSVIARRAVNCSADMAIPDYQLNYPSVSVSFPPTWSSSPPISVGRTVTNVGEVPPEVIYYPEVEIPADSPVNVTVFPPELLFTETNQARRFEISVEAKNSSAGAVQGAIRWVSDNHIVRIPISVTFATH